jgi:diaminohydroxyphosphoribosylaminopyrimidine deaminase/5-amino-6-(5-phosphoribosylamino)uracil reductase
MHNDEYFLSRALRLAEKGLWNTDPNPRVGCVLVKDGEIVGEGWHEKAGLAHAEINALRMAGERARGADCYVTLEPCCHHGRTPPCSEALIQAGVGRVVAAMEDPNPRVAGQGLRQLQEAGIEVVSGLLQAQAERLNPGFIQRMRQGRPWIRGKLAMSLDGRTAMASGESKWITGSAARSDVQAWRARSSALMTGAGTVLADDPSYTVRREELPAHLPRPAEPRQPLRVIVDRNLSIPETAKMLSLPGKTLVFYATQDADSAERAQDLERAGAEVVYLPTLEGCVDLIQVCRHLAEREVNEVLLEAGANLGGAMLRAGLIDEFIFYIAPVLMGDSARGLFHLPQLQRMADKIQLRIEDIRAVGEDWRIIARPMPVGEG